MWQSWASAQKMFAAMLSVNCSAAAGHTTIRRHSSLLSDHDDVDVPEAPEKAGGKKPTHSPEEQVVEVTLLKRRTSSSRNNKASEHLHLCDRS